jgi:hypothetical protein
VKRDTEKITELISDFFLNELKIAGNKKETVNKFEKDKRKNKLLKYL